jgi:hypothetical protein
VNSFQFTRLTRLGLAHQDLQDKQEGFTVSGRNRENIIGLMAEN